jgi:ribosomal protein L11 methyltransferase
VFELILAAPEHRVEALSDALVEEAQALSVTVEDADAGGTDEKPMFGEPGLPAPRAAWQHSTLRALFETEAQATEAATVLMAQDWSAELRVLGLQAVPQADWVRLTQAQFEPVFIAPGFWVVPSWHQLPADAQRVIRLDPGMAFGTGTHPTTRMCLRWISRHAPALGAPGVRVLDYGCGSGILAIGAALHGATSLDAVDIDPAAVDAALSNAQAHGLAQTMRVGDASLAQGAYGVVLANILATPLKLLAPLLCAHLASGGHLVLAGILERQAEELTQAYAPWIDLHVADTEDGWILMTGTRASDQAVD